MLLTLPDGIPIFAFHLKSWFRTGSPYLLSLPVNRLMPLLSVPSSFVCILSDSTPNMNNLKNQIPFYSLTRRNLF
jgi:hypothetical protein